MVVKNIFSLISGGKNLCGKIVFLLYFPWKKKTEPSGSMGHQTRQRRDVEDDPKPFVIGDQDCSGTEEDTACNGPLNPGKSYK